MHCSLQEHSFAISLLRSLRSRRIPPLPTLCHLKAQLYCSAHSEWAEERQFYDNHSAGGLCIRVDLGTAELDSVAFDYFGNKYTGHPDTGFVFAGQKLPFFKVYKSCKFYTVNTKHWPGYQLCRKRTRYPISEPSMGITYNSVS